MTIAILATGDEIVHGDTLNTNGHQIAHILSSEGIPLGFHLTCSDKLEDIVNSLNFLSKQHHIIIVIGGLGPTTDDLTRFALAQFAGETLVENSVALEHVKKRLQTNNVTMSQGNLQQCLFPEKATILPNPHGTAVGCSYTWNNTIFYLLPGPPRECLPMFNDYVLPDLQNVHHSEKQLLKWRIFGLAESEIAQTLEEALATIDCQTGYRLEAPYIEFKVRCQKEWVQQVKNVVDPILAPHLIASLDKKASEKLQELILSMNQSITVIDEATGGLLQTLLTTPETQHLINFHGLKRTKLFFHISGLNDYWKQLPKNGYTQLTIHYSNHSQEGGETHQIPYRSPLVTYYAAEWLSFRLFHLINQLHQ